MFGTINAAVMGTGRIAEKMAETMKSTRRVRPYAVGSRNLDRAVDFAKKNGFRRAYGSYEDLLADRKVDLVYVATPHSEHYRNALAALEAGKNVLVEKPICVTEQQAKKLAETAEKKNLFLGEAMWTRFLPFGEKIREVLESGVIGDLVSLSADVGWNIRSVPRMTDPELAGGTLLDTGIYALNFASMFFGEDIYKIHAVCSYTDKRLDEQDSITLIYRDGRVAVLSASMVGCSARQGILTGTKGYAVVDDIVNFRSLTVYDAAGKKLAFYKRPRQKTGFEYELSAAVSAIREGRTECREMPHRQSLSEMHMMDFIRGQMGIVYPFEIRQKQEEQRRQDEEDRKAAIALEEKAKEALAAKEEEEERGQIASDIQAQEAIEGHVSIGDETDYTFGTAENVAVDAGEEVHLPSEDTLVHAAGEAMKEDARLKAEEKAGALPAPSKPEPGAPGDVTSYIDLPLHAGNTAQGETPQDFGTPESAPNAGEKTR